MQGNIPTIQDLSNDLNETFSKLPKDKLSFFDVFDKFVKLQSLKFKKLLPESTLL